MLFPKHSKSDKKVIKAIKQDHSQGKNPMHGCRSFRSVHAPSTLKWLNLLCVQKLYNPEPPPHFYHVWCAKPTRTPITKGNKRTAGVTGLILSPHYKGGEILQICGKKHGLCIWHGYDAMWGKVINGFWNLRIWYACLIGLPLTFFPHIN